MLVYQQMLHASKRRPTALKNIFTDELYIVAADACEPEFAPHAGVMFVLTNLLQDATTVAWPNAVLLTQIMLAQGSRVSVASAPEIVEELLAFVHVCSKRDACMLKTFASTISNVLCTCCHEAAWTKVQHTAFFRKLAVLLKTDSDLGSALVGNPLFLGRVLQSAGVEPCDGSLPSPQTCVAAFTALCLLPRLSSVDSDLFRRAFMNCAVANVPLSVMTHMLDNCLEFIPVPALEACARLTWSHVQHAVALLKTSAIAYCALLARVALVAPAALAVPFTEPQTSLYRLCDHVDALLLHEPCLQLQLSFYHFAKSAWKLTRSQDARCCILRTLVKFATFACVINGAVLLIQSAEFDDSAELYEQTLADNMQLSTAVRLVHCVATGEDVQPTYMQAVAWTARWSLEKSTSLGADGDFVQDVAAVYTDCVDASCRRLARDILEEVADDYFDVEQEDAEQDGATDIDEPAPALTFTDGTMVTEPLLCTVCQETNTGPHVFLPCAHNFHVECINAWLRTGALSCPLCKLSLSDTATHTIFHSNP